MEKNTLVNISPNNKSNNVFIISYEDDAVNWRRQIEDILSSYDILTQRLEDACTALIIMGLRFTKQLASIQAKGKHNNDIVLAQIRLAVDKKKLVIPVLVEGIDGSILGRLPADIRRLSFNQALIVHSESYLPGAVARVVEATRSIDLSKGEVKVSDSQSGISVFISYRRSDSIYWARELARSLTLELGSAAVFLDIGRGRPGKDFREEIKKAINQCSAVAVLIGISFFEPDTRGTRRIDQPNDYVRNEIRLALLLRKPIYIVLASNAKMPTRKQLPDDIAELVDMKSVLTFSSIDDAENIAQDIIENTRSLSISRDKLFQSPFFDRGVVRIRTLGVEKIMKSTVEALSQHGWKVVAQPKYPDRYYMLVNGHFPSYRLCLSLNTAEAILEEKLKSSSRLGFSRWIERSFFPVSPYNPNEIDLLRLPDGLLEAALDPKQFLDRTGRRDNVGKLRKVLKSYVFDGNVRHLNKPNFNVAEQHLRFKRKVMEQGGIKPLVRERRLPMIRIVESPVYAIDFCSKRNCIVAVIEKGVVLINEYGLRLGEFIGHDEYKLIEVSQHGNIALGSEKGKISIWDSKGSVIVQSATPYSWKQRLIDSPTFHMLSWSKDNNLLACAGKDAVWLFSITNGKFSKWDYPEQIVRQLFRFGTQFTSDGEKLVVYAGFKHIWVVDLRTKKFGDYITIKNEYQINHIDASPKLETLACAGDYGRIILLDYKSLKEKQVICGHEPMDKRGMKTQVDFVSFSPDGKRLVSHGSDNQMMVWDVSTWMPLRSVKVSVGFRSISSLKGRIVWSPDSRQIITRDPSGSIDIWHI